MQRCISWPNTGMGTHPTQRAAERTLPAPPAANRQQGPFIQPPTLACPHAANNTAHRCSRSPPRHITRQLSSPTVEYQEWGGGGRAGHRTETDPTTEERAKIEVNKHMPVPARLGPNYPHQRHTPRELLDNTHCAVLPSSAVLSSSAPAGIDNTHARHKQGASSSYTLT